MLYIQELLAHISYWLQADLMLKKTSARASCSLRSWGRDGMGWGIAKQL